MITVAGLFTAYAVLAAATEDLGWIVLLSLVAYYPLTLLGVSIGVGVVTAARGAVNGEPVGLRIALGAVRARSRQIAAWALLATGVGVVLDYVLERVPGGGRLAAWALGAAWSIATLFVVPILALEGCSVRECVKRSVSAFRGRWGEGVVGSLSIFAALVVVTIPACAAIGYGISALAVGESAARHYAAAIGGGTLMAAAAFAAIVMRDVFAFALYRYAADGVVVGGFPRDDLDDALKLKPAKPRWRRAALDPGLEDTLKRGRRSLWGLLALEAVALPAHGIITDAGSIATLIVAGAIATGVAGASARRAGWRAPGFRGVFATAVLSAMKTASISVYAVMEAAGIDGNALALVWLLAAAAAWATLIAMTVAAWRRRDGPYRP